MAAAGERGLLVDSNLLRPTQHKLAARACGPGLCDLLSGRKSVDQVMQTGSALYLDFLPNRESAGFTLSQLHINRRRVLIGELRARSEKIVFDSPPNLGVGDAPVLASVVDGAILLIQHRRDPQSMVMRAQQVVELIKTPLIGAVPQPSAARIG